MPWDEALTELSTILGQRLSRSKSDLNLHSGSESWLSSMPPDAVAYPETTDEVAQIMRICAAHHMPVIGWGTGTSLEGQAQAPKGGLCVDFSRMDKVLSVSPENMLVTVQPGVTREALNEELRATGLFFPVDPGANASLGGMAATRASGTTTVRYGTMRENVLALEVVTASGEIIRTGSQARKSASGYDLTHLFVGSEGTLGLITELTLRLHGIPEATSTALCVFDTVTAAVETVILTIQSGLNPARLELVDSASVAALNAHFNGDMPEKPHLLVEFQGSTGMVTEQAENFAELAREFGARDFDWTTDAEKRTKLWWQRHNAFYAVKALRPKSRTIVTDICVPISRLAEAIDETAKDLQDLGVTGPILGHVGDGNFHSSLFYDPEDTDEFTRAKEAAHRMVKRSLALGGTATGEHGIGIGKRDYMAQEHGPAWALMGTIKTALDPDNILNPGKLVPERN